MAVTVEQGQPPEYGRQVIMRIVMSPPVAVPVPPVPPPRERVTGLRENDRA